MDNVLNQFYAVADILQKSFKSKPMVVCIGAYNHGKSSLLNALTKNYDDSRFKVADKRETTENKSYEYEGIIYTDTPGFNATSEDDICALNAVLNSDVNIFVHSQNEGELSKKEIDYLIRLLDFSCTNKMLIDKTIFVMNHVEGLSDEEIDNAKQRFIEQIDEVFGLKPMLFVAKTTSYTKAMRENKAILAKQSGLEEIKELMLKFCECDIVEYRRKKHLLLVYNEIINLLQQKLKTNSMAINDEKTKNRLVISEINQMMQGIENIKSRLKLY